MFVGINIVIRNGGTKKQTEYQIMWTHACKCICLRACVRVCVCVGRCVCDMYVYFVVMLVSVCEFRAPSLSVWVISEIYMCLRVGGAKSKSAAKLAKLA